jgi:hypothetical protein
MTTYKKIIEKVINIDNNIFSNHFNPNDEVSFNIKIFFQHLLSFTNVSIKNKFFFYIESLKSPLLTSKEDFIYYFYKIQKIYNTLNKFVFHYKYNKSKLVVQKDMCLNDIKMNEANIINIFHYNAKYLFHIKDLLKIIYTSLTNSHLFFAEPLSIKNPYNNLPFNKCDLYNIYFYMKNNTNIYDDLFFKFFTCDFNLYLFFNRYEYILREYCIENYLKGTCKNVLFNEIIKMINKYNVKMNLKKKIKIDNSFPKNKLVKIMSPYLKLELKNLYSLSTIINMNSQVELMKKLIQFNKYNPNFGRKILKMGYKNELKNGVFIKKTFIKEIIYNEDHIPFNQNCVDNFSTNHLFINETYNRNYNIDDINQFINNNNNNNENRYNLFVGPQFYFDNESDAESENNHDTESENESESNNDNVDEFVNIEGDYEDEDDEEEDIDSLS